MKYEFMYILRPFLAEDVREKTQDQIKKIIKKEKGKILKEDLWGKRHLAYSIDGNDEGYYVVSDITIEGNADNVRKELNLLDNILRYIIRKKDNI